MTSSSPEKNKTKQKLALHVKKKKKKKKKARNGTHTISKNAFAKQQRERCQILEEGDDKYPSVNFIQGNGSE